MLLKSKTKWKTPAPEMNSGKLVFGRKVALQEEFLSQVKHCFNHTRMKQPSDTPTTTTTSLHMSELGTQAGPVWTMLILRSTGSWVSNNVVKSSQSWLWPFNFSAEKEKTAGAFILQNKTFLMKILCNALWPYLRCIQLDMLSFQWPTKRDMTVKWNNSKYLGMDGARGRRAQT